MEGTIASLFSLENIKNLTIESDDQAIAVHGDLLGLEAYPRCKSTDLHRHTKKVRRLHLPPCGMKKTFIYVHTQKQECTECGRTWRPPIPFARGLERMTHAFVNYVIGLLRFGTIQDVSQFTGVSRDTVKNLHKRHLRQE